ncbi:pirin family protein [Streptomyces clavuligerus]|nr:pirin family protein [Streptomyces clavuligerus]
MGVRPGPAVAYRGGVIDVRRAGDRHRGGEPDRGIGTRHSFSFGAHYDPDNLRFGALIACNEESLAPGAGFAEHPHSHTEIVTWVAEGELTHRDSTGTATVVRPGDLQYLSAASGVRHTERNDGDRPLVFVQMWLAPLEPGGARYEVVRGLGDTADGTGYPCPGRARCSGCTAGPRGTGAAAARSAVHVQVVRGAVRLDGTGGADRSTVSRGGARAGDAARISGGEPWSGGDGGPGGGAGLGDGGPVRAEPPRRMRGRIGRAVPR